MMRRIKDVKEEYDPGNETGRKKIILIDWFQKRPGKRFDRMEVHHELQNELGVGQARVGQYLNDLEEDSVLDSHGDQRKAYRIADDILIPVKYQATAGLRQISTIFDFERWGIVGFLVISTVFWTFLTLPFWVFSFYLIVSPMDSIGTINESNIYISAILMTIWLLIFVIASYVLFQIRNWWHKVTAGNQETANDS